jgi:hypothetical protein
MAAPGFPNAPHRLTVPPVGFNSSSNDISIQPAGEAIHNSKALEIASQAECQAVALE